MGEAIILMLLIPILFLAAFLAACIGDVPGAKKTLLIWIMASGCLCLSLLFELLAGR